MECSSQNGGGQTLRELLLQSQHLYFQPRKVATQAPSPLAANPFGPHGYATTKPNRGRNQNLLSQTVGGQLGNLKPGHVQPAGSRGPKRQRQPLQSIGLQLNTVVHAASRHGMQPQQAEAPKIVYRQFNNIDSAPSDPRPRQHHYHLLSDQEPYPTQPQRPQPPMPKLQPRLDVNQKTLCPEPIDSSKKDGSVWPGQSKQIVSTTNSQCS
jgi:hypothetical protein